MPWLSAALQSLDCTRRLKRLETLNQTMRALNPPWAVPWQDVGPNNTSTLLSLAV